MASSDYYSSMMTFSCSTSLFYYSDFYSASYSYISPIANMFMILSYSSFSFWSSWLILTSSLVSYGAWKASRCLKFSQSLTNLSSASNLVSNCLNLRKTFCKFESLINLFSPSREYSVIFNLRVLPIGKAFSKDSSVTPSTSFNAMIPVNFEE
jgi:hypothetical protein